MRLRGVCKCDYECGGVKRAWIYPRNEWLPRRRWLPGLGGDEHDQLTVVLPIPFGGWLILALWA